MQARQVRFQDSGFSQSDQGMTHCFRSLRGVVVKLLALLTRGRRLDLKPRSHDNFPGQNADKDVL